MVKDLETSALTTIDKRAAIEAVLVGLEVDGPSKTEALRVTRYISNSQDHFT